jgi:hypothetical protein
VLKDTISKVTGAKISSEVQQEINLVAPVVATNIEVFDRITLASELKNGLPKYKPSPAVSTWIAETPILEIAAALPSL